MDDSQSDQAQTAEAQTAEAPDRLRRAEAVIQGRTGRFAVVLERVLDSHNHSAVIRSAEAMGIQNIFIVNNLVERNETERAKTVVLAKKITKNCYKWLTIRNFDTTAECIEALRADGYSIWATDLAREAVSLNDRAALLPVPPKVAVVIGRESDGVSREMLDVCDKRCFMPMYGFTESFNVSVACALFLQRLFDVCPEAHGDLPEEQKASLRREWFAELTKNATAKLACGAFLAEPERVTPLDDLRRPEGERESWAPPKIKKREAAAVAALEGGASKKPGSPDLATGP